MRNRIIVACAVVLGVCSFQAMADDQENCSLRSLKGTYHYAAKTIVDDYYDQTEAGEAGMESFDGNGHFVNINTHNHGGHLPATSNSAATGTYTINANCVGTLTYSTGEIETVYVDPKGDDFTWVTSDGPGESTVGEEHRISRKLLVQAPI